MQIHPCKEIIIKNMSGPKTAPNDTAYTRWSCHSGLANRVQIVSTPHAPSNGDRLPFFWASQSRGPAVWVVLLLIKVGDVDTNPGTSNTREQVWICDICHRQIQARKQISIRCNRIEHWVHLSCAGIRQAKYTDTWTYHQYKESRLTTNTDLTPPHPPRLWPKPSTHAHPPPPQHHRNQNTDTYTTFPLFLQDW